jgi:hypothetical protein
MFKNRKYVDLKRNFDQKSSWNSDRFKLYEPIIQLGGKKRKRSNYRSDSLHILHQGKEGEEKTSWVKLILATFLSVLGLLLVVLFDIFNLQGKANGEQPT